MEIDRRIIALIEILGLTPGEFADKISVQRSGISHITSGRNKPSLDFLERTLTVFPEINSEWLVLGKGKPLKSQIEDRKEEVFLSAQNTDSENPSPLLFSIDDFESESIDQNTVFSPSEIPVNNLTSEKDTSVKNTDKEKEEFSNSKEKKKEINKIIILYKDNSFETYEN